MFPADGYFGVAIAGAAGPAIEMVKLFQLQLEHYEKVEGIVLSLEGKANQLSHMVRSNLGLAHAGPGRRAAVRGLRPRRGDGRLFAYDVTGGRYEEHMNYSVGSGSLFAPASLKKLFRPDLSVSEATTVIASRRSTTPPTRTPPPAAPTCPAGSSRSSPSSTRTVTAGWPKPRSRRSSRPSSQPGVCARRPAKHPCSDRSAERTPR